MVGEIGSERWVRSDEPILTVLRAPVRNRLGALFPQSATTEWFRTLCAPWNAALGIALNVSPECVATAHCIGANALENASRVAMIANVVNFRALLVAHTSARGPYFFRGVLIGHWRKPARPSSKDTRIKHARSRRYDKSHTALLELSQPAPPAPRDAYFVANRAYRKRGPSVRPESEWKSHTYAADLSTVIEKRGTISGSGSFPRWERPRWKNLLFLSEQFENARIHQITNCRATGDTFRFLQFFANNAVGNR